MNYIFLILFFILIPQLASANVIQFPSSNNLSDVTKWDCMCDNESICKVETIDKQAVMTIPTHCSVISTYSDSDNAAIQFEVMTLEKPSSVKSVMLVAKNGSFYQYRYGINTSLHSNIYHTISSYMDLNKNKKITLAIDNPMNQPLHVVNSFIHLVKNSRSGAILGGFGGSLQGTYTIEKPSDNTAWIPLPLDYENQVPLDVHFEINPQSVIKFIKYKSDELGNWGAEIQFNDNIPNGKKIDFTWDAIVLTNDIKHESYTTPLMSNEWLLPSEMVQSTDPDIEKTAKLLVDDSSKMKTIVNIVDWLNTNLQFGAEPPYDALHVFNIRKGPCNGYANLAAAFARSAKIPAMTLAGYLVGEGQETHWINQFNLGSDIGWIRIEPQKLVQVDSEFLIAVRMDRFLDEMNYTTILGIPNNAYPLIPIAFTRPNQQILDAQDLIEFAEPEDKMNVVFNKARDAWQKDFKIFLSASIISTKRQKIRGQMKHVKSLNELNELLDKLSKTE